MGCGCWARTRVRTRSAEPKREPTFRESAADLNSRAAASTRPVRLESECRRCAWGRGRGVGRESAWCWVSTSQETSRDGIPPSGAATRRQLIPCRAFEVSSSSRSTRKREVAASTDKGCENNFERLPVHVEGGGDHEPQRGGAGEHVARQPLRHGHPSTTGPCRASGVTRSFRLIPETREAQKGKRRKKNCFRGNTEPSISNHLIWRNLIGWRLEKRRFLRSQIRGFGKRN